MTNFEYQMRNHYGTLKQFREDMKINHITAARYFKDPDRIQLRFFKRLADKTGIPIETLISDKIVGEGEE